MSILTLFVVIPVIMLLGLWLSRNLAQIRGVMVVGATALLALSAWLTITFIQMRNAGNTDPMLFTYSVPWFKSLNIAYSVGVDGVSVVMILLSSIIVFTGTFASWQLKPLTKEYFLWFVLLSIGVYGFFISTDMFTMFMFYEVALIPMYLLIGVWGSGKKEYAAMIPFHTWSPDGHASAPTAVSMLHAGVLMKLGGYGCFRIAMYLLPNAAHDLSWIFLILTTCSVVYGAFSACVQTDLKYINAYSSVSHCGLVLFALLMMTQTSCTGAVLQMLSHGLMTALFFALIGMIYGRTHTRDIRQLGGLMKIMPFLSVGYVVAGLANLGLPGFSGFVAEMTVFVGSFENGDTFHRVCTIIACTSIVTTAVYILRTVGKILYGKVADPHFEELTDATWDERFSVICLIFCVAALGIAPFWASDIINSSLGPLLHHIHTFGAVATM